MMNEAQMVDDLVETLDSDDLTYIKELAENDLIMLHHSLGRQIRNHYGLWLIEWAPEIVDEVDVSENHPDAISMRVIRKLHERLNAD